MSTSAERALVGLILKDRSVLDVAIEHGISADSFYDETARNVFAAIVDAEAHSRSIDLLSLASTMPSGWSVKLLELDEEAPVATNPAFFAKEVADAAWAREMSLKLAREYAAFSKREPYESIESLKEAVASLVAEATMAGEKIPTSADVVQRSIASLEERVNAVREGRKVGLSSGFSVLDRIIGGFLPGAMYVLAARKKVGKTTLAVNIALNVAEAGTPTAYFTVEMRDQEIVDQAIIRRSAVEADKYVHGKLNDPDLMRVSDAAAEVGRMPLFVREVRDPSAEKLLHDIRRLRRTRGVRFVVIDYTQQFRYSTQRFGSRQQELTLLTSQIKSLATELQISILAIAQLNRSAEEAHEPSSSQIKDSGSFEQDADAIIMLWSECDGAHIVNVSDNRRGPTGRFVLKSDLSRKIFRE